VVDIIEDHDMPHVQFLGQTVPLSNCHTNVNQQKKWRVERITQLDLWNVDAIKEFISRPTKCSNSIDSFLSQFNT
jgi:hypothetical protein